MATPTISVDSTGGSSDTTASGAGPATAISGSTGRTRNTAAQLRFGFFGATDDFSGVATDGSHALYMAISTAGARNFSSIAGMKNTRQTGSDAAITSATAILVVGSTTGWSVGDVIKVAGAGAAGADLYSTILTVDSGIQATLNDNAGTTVAAAAWENPKQATLSTSQGVNTGTTDTAWAIGGKRATIGGANSVKLIENNSGNGDAMPGWITEMKSGHSETIAATINCRRSGDTTSGPIVLRGVAAAATLPLLTFSNNGDAIVPRANYWQFQNFEFQNTNATKTASRAIANLGTNGILIRRVKVSHSTNKFWRGIDFYANTGGTATVVDCEVGYCASIGILGSKNDAANIGGVKIIGCYIHDCGGGGIQFTNVAWFSCSVINNIIYNNTGIGLSYDNSRTDALAGLSVVGNTISSNTSDGFRIVTANAAMIENTPIINNIFSSNGGYGINFNSGTFTDVFLTASNLLILGNNFYNNTSGKYNPSTISISLFETTTDPAFSNASGGDFSIGTNLKAKGYPLAGTQYVGTTSITYSYVDPGAAQRQESGSGATMFIPVE